MPRIYMILDNFNSRANINNIRSSATTNTTVSLGGVRNGNSLKNNMLVRLSGSVSCGSCGK